jgi:hypothetical protein
MDDGSGMWCAEPTEAPTAMPTKTTPAPTKQPTDEPTAKPTMSPTMYPSAKPTMLPTEEPTVQMVYGVGQSNEGEGVQHFSAEDSLYRQDEGMMSNVGGGVNMGDGSSVSLDISVESSRRDDDDGFSVHPRAEPKDMNMGDFPADGDDDASEEKQRANVQVQPNPIDRRDPENLDRPEDKPQGFDLTLTAVAIVAGVVVFALIVGRRKPSTGSPVVQKGSQAIVLTPADGAAEFL